MPMLLAHKGTTCLVGKAPKGRGSSASASPSTARATCSPPGARLKLRRPAEQALQLSGQPAEAGVIRLAGNDAVALHDNSPL
jgi:hypothetical protein